MDAIAVAGCFKDRTILVTGSTGFLGKLLVEKILRVQPGVKKLYLLVRAPGDANAEQRVLDEVVGKELFNVLQEKHRTDFPSFIKKKITPLAGDITHEDLGFESTQAKQLFEEIDIIVNAAATTSFYQRYDVALATNAFGTAHVCQFAKQCPKLKMFLHVSTAYVAGEQKGLLLEKPFHMGQSLNQDRHLDTEAELELANEVKEKLVIAWSGTDNWKQLEKVAMKELGFKRSVSNDNRRHDCCLLRAKLPCFIHNATTVFDAIPGDMVINAAMVAMATHYAGDNINAGTQVVYHVSSALQKPLPCYLLEESTYGYFFINPPEGDEGRTAIQLKRPLLFTRYAYFYAYMLLVYKIPLKMLYLVNLLLGGFLSEYHNKLNRKFNYLMLVAKFYAPYAFFKGCFDDTNLRKLWSKTVAERGDGYVFNFDPSCISWRLYLFNTHIPAVLKVAHMTKEGTA